MKGLKRGRTAKNSSEGYLKDVVSKMAEGLMSGSKDGSALAEAVAPAIGDEGDVQSFGPVTDDPVEIDTVTVESVPPVEEPVEGPHSGPVEGSHSGPVEADVVVEDDAAVVVSPVEEVVTPAAAVSSDANSVLNLLRQREFNGRGSHSASLSALDVLRSRTNSGALQSSIEVIRQRKEA